MRLIHSDNSDMFAEIVDQLSSLNAPGISLEDDLENAGKKILLYQLGQMLAYQPIAYSGEDIEGVHKMRVATRRMRTLFRYLKPVFKQKSFRPFRQYIAHIGRTLGEVRDLDVIRLVLQEHELEGIEEWNTAYENKYKIARESLIALISSEAYEQGLIDFYKFLTMDDWKYKKKVVIPGPKEPEGFFPEMLLGQWQLIIGSYAGIKPEPYTELHRLRIELKRLRYLIEFFQEILQREDAQKAILAIIQLQDHLGHLNDVYNSVQLLAGMMEDHPGLVPQLNGKHNELAAIQEQSALSFIALWVEFQSGEINNTLEKLVPQSI